MLNVSEPRLSKQSRFFRYLFYLASGVRFKSFQSWSKEGEPNPFVAKVYRQKQTERVEFDDIFEDLLNDR